MSSGPHGSIILGCLLVGPYVMNPGTYLVAVLVRAETNMTESIELVRKTVQEYFYLLQLSLIYNRLSPCSNH